MVPHFCTVFLDNVVKILVDVIIEINFFCEPMMRVIYDVRI